MYHEHASALILCMPGNFHDFFLTNIRFFFHMTFRITLKSYFWCEKVKILSLCMYATLLRVSLHRGSYMSAQVSLNFSKELGKRDKMRGLLSILSLFSNVFNKFNNTKAGMLDSTYHMTLRLLLKSHFWHKKVVILSLCMQLCYGLHNVSRKSVNH